VEKVLSKSATKYAGRILPVALLAVALSACAMSKITSPFGSSKSEQQKANNPVSNETLLDAARTDTTGQVDMASAATHCPRFTAWPRDRLLTIYDIGRVGDGQAIKHRGEITKTARECQISPTRITVKYGFAGRILLGPLGRPGRITLPVKVHITDRNRNIIATKKHNLSVTIAPDNPIGFFSTVGNISIPLPAGTTSSDYHVYVAFDRTAPGAG